MGGSNVQLIHVCVLYQQLVASEKMNKKRGGGNGRFRHSDLRLTLLLRLVLKYTPTLHTIMSFSRCYKMQLGVKLFKYNDANKGEMTDRKHGYNVLRLAFLCEFFI